MSKTAILLVDIQYDFCTGGSLAVPNAEEIIEPVNRMLAKFPDAPVFASRDWHPPITRHFQKGGGLWPPHCVADTRGAAFHAGINMGKAMIYSKGQDPQDDGGYSAFEAIRLDGCNKISMAADMAQMKIDHLIVAGLATDYCVKASVLDALKAGIKVGVNIHGCRAVADATMAQAIEEMAKAGAVFYSDI